MDANPLTRQVFAWGVREGVRALEAGRRSWPAELLLFGALARPPGLLAGEVGRHRRCRPRARHLQVLPRHGRAAAPALRPDRALGRLHAPGREGDRLRQLRRCSSPTARSGSKHRTSRASARSSPAMPACSKATSATRRRSRETLTEDGWMRTGDAGYFDAKGRLVVIDRVKDIATHQPCRALLAPVHREQAQVLALTSASAWCWATTGPGSPPSCASATRWWRNGPKAAGSASPPTRTSPPTPRSASCWQARSRRSTPACPKASASAASCCSTRSSTPTTAS